MVTRRRRRATLAGQLFALQLGIIVVVLIAYVLYLRTNKRR